MVFLQHYHAEVSLNIPTRERWTPHASELLGPATIANARIAGFPAYGKGPEAWLLCNDLPVGGSSTASRHSLSMNPSRTHRNRPAAPSAAVA